jgi:Bacterial transglutaminase-like N-terminal region
MTVLTVRHITTYQYKQPVSFGEHRIMLRPRDDEDAGDQTRLYAEALINRGVTLRDLERFEDGASFATDTM